MTRERWEQVLFAHVPDEVVQDMLNDYVLELESENANLREEIESAKHDLSLFSSELVVSKAENAKMRELVKKLYGGYMGGHYMISCDGCEHAYEDYGGYEPLDPDYCVFSFSDRYVGCWKQKRLEAEMRELGIEVD